MHTRLFRCVLTTWIICQSACVENELPGAPETESPIDETQVDEAQNGGNVPVGTSNLLGFDMVLIDTSEGDPLGRYTLTRNFYMMTTEITQKHVRTIFDYYEVNPGDNDCRRGVGDNYPAYNFAWSEFAALANALSEQEDLPNCYECTGTDIDIACEAHPDYSGSDAYNCPGYRFPTQAEWEYAARSGSTQSFWTGDGEALGGDADFVSCDPDLVITDNSSNPLLADFAWFCGNSNGECGEPNFGAKEVGQKRPNGFGLYDMHGNISEWTIDTYNEDYVPNGVDPIDTAGRQRYATAGGFWEHFPTNMTVTSRRYGPDVRAFRHGARFVRNAP